MFGALSFAPGVFYFYVDSFYAPANPNGRDSGPYMLVVDTPRRRWRRGSGGTRSGVVMREVVNHCFAACSLRGGIPSHWKIWKSFVKQSVCPGRSERMIDVW